MSFVVVQEGVYYHGTWGPYATLQEACDNARRLAAEDRDSYHNWCVFEISPDTGLGKEHGWAEKGSKIGGLPL